MIIHRSVTMDRVLDLAEESMFGMTSSGICLGCGEDAMHVEPDARRYECDVCGERQVYGAEELLLAGRYHQ